MGVHVTFVYCLGSSFVRLSLIMNVGVSCTVVPLICLYNAFLACLEMEGAHASC
jgi:hypothetical protein